MRLGQQRTAWRLVHNQGLCFDSTQFCVEFHLRPVLISGDSAASTVTDVDIAVVGGGVIGLSMCCALGTRILSGCFVVFDPILVHHSVIGTHKRSSSGARAAVISTIVWICSTVCSVSFVDSAFGRFVCIASSVSAHPQHGTLLSCTAQQSACGMRL
jgi:hypothetical protein